MLFGVKEPGGQVLELNYLDNKHHWLSEQPLWKAGFNAGENSGWGAGGGILLRRTGPQCVTGWWVIGRF